MRQRPILTLENLNFGNQLKQSDQSMLRFKLVREGERLRLAGKRATCFLMKCGKIYYAQTVKVSEDNVVEFNIDTAVETGEYTLEVVVGNQYFPSDHEVKLTIVHSSNRPLLAEIEYYGVEAIKQDVLKSTLKHISDEVEKHIGGMTQSQADNRYARHDHSHDIADVTGAISQEAINDEFDKLKNTIEELEQEIAELKENSGRVKNDRTNRYLDVWVGPKAIKPDSTNKLVFVEKE